MAIGAQQPGEDSEAAAVGRGPIPRLPAGTAAADIEVAAHARRARIHAIALLVLSLGFSAGAFGLVYGAIAAHHPAARSGVVVAAVNCGIPFGAASAQSIAGRLDPALVFVPVMLGVIVSLFGALILWAAARTPEGALHRCLPD